MLPFSNAGSTAWKVRRPQGWVFTNTVVQSRASYYHALSSIGRQRGCLGLPGLCSSAAAMPSPSSRLWLLRKQAFSWRHHHQSGSFYYFSQFLCSWVIALFKTEVLRLQWPLKPLETFTKNSWALVLNTLIQSGWVRLWEVSSWWYEYHCLVGSTQEQRTKDPSFCLSKTWSRCSGSLEPIQFTKQGFYILF